AGVRLGAAQEAAPGELVTEEDVLGDRQAVDDVELLVHRRDTELEGGGRRVDGDDLAVPPDLPGVRLVRTGQDLDEGGLAGAVLPEQAVHLAGTDLEVHAVEGLGAGEVLDDAGELKEGDGVRCDHGDTVWGHFDVRQSKVGKEEDSYVSVTCGSNGGLLTP